MGSFILGTDMLFITTLLLPRLLIANYFSMSAGTSLFIFILNFVLLKAMVLTLNVYTVILCLENSSYELFSLLAPALPMYMGEVPTLYDSDSDFND